MRITKYYEWLLREGQSVKVGLTPKACAELNDISFIQLPEVGVKVEEGQYIALLETTKSAIELFSPFEGIVEEVNNRLIDDISPLNKGSIEERWIYTITPVAIDLYDSFSPLIGYN